MIAELIMRCFHARTNAHMQHLMVTGVGSDAAHRALEMFYEGIVDLADEVAECYLGIYDELPGAANIPYRQAASRLEIVTDLAKWIEANRYKCCEKTDTALQNLIDEIVALCAKTAFKLRRLK